MNFISKWIYIDLKLLKDFKDYLHKIVNKSFICVYPNEYKGYLVPRQTILNICTEKYNLIQKITEKVNYFDLPRQNFWAWW